MKRIASVLSTIPLAGGLLLAQSTTSTNQSQSSSTQTGSQTSQTGSEAGMSGQTGNSWYGILVDAKCTSTGMTGAGSSSSMNTSGSMNHSMHSGTTNQSMNTGTPGSTGGRTWNSTDRNTSGTADRGSVGATGSTGTTGSTGPAANTANSDLHSTAAGRDNARDMNRSNTGTDTRDMDRSGTSSTSSNSGAMTAQNRSGQSGTDMNRTTGATGSGRGLDTQSGNNSMTGSSDRSGTTSTSGWNSTAEWASGDNSAGTWDRSCYISPGSTAFVLHTQDGRMIRLDDAANSRIVSQLQSTNRVQNASKIFRVKVTGTMSGDTLSLTDIQM